MVVFHFVAKAADLVHPRPINGDVQRHKPSLDLMILYCPLATALKDDIATRANHWLEFPLYQYFVGALGTQFDQSLLEEQEHARVEIPDTRHQPLGVRLGFTKIIEPKRNRVDGVVEKARDRFPVLCHAHTSPVLSQFLVREFASVLARVIGYDLAFAEELPFIDDEAVEAAQ